MHRPGLLPLRGGVLGAGAGVLREDGRVREPARWEVAVRRLLIPLALAVGVLWWWAVLRLALVPEDSGTVEGAVAVGGWGLGLLPVHCTSRLPVRRARGPPGLLGLPGRLRGRKGLRGPLRGLPGHRHSAVRAQDLARHEG